MASTTYIVDGQCLVDNIHFIKACVYDGQIKVHIPACAAEVAEKLHRKAMEPKELPKNDKPKRWSGRIRREQQPLFDINPRTTMEFLERGKLDDGIKGLTFQSEGQNFSPWRGQDTKLEESAMTSAPAQLPTPPPAPAPSTWTDALLRQLNIKEVEQKVDDSSGRPKLVSMATNGKSSSPLRHHKVPDIPVQRVSKDLQGLLGCALWKRYECDSDPLKVERFEILTDQEKTIREAQAIELPACTGRALRSRVLRFLAETDHREDIGELEEEFPHVPRRVMMPSQQQPKVKISNAIGPKAGVNGHAATVDETERALEAVALSVVQGLEQTDTLDLKSEEQLTRVIAAELRPSISYAMAAGSNSSTPAKPAMLAQALPPQNSSPKHLPSTSAPKREGDNVVIPAHAMAEEADMPEHVPLLTASLAKSTFSAEDESDSDEEVVVFNPKARQAAQANKKHRSREMASPPVKPNSRPATANGPNSIQPSSPRPSSTVLNSVLKPDSPVFSPRQGFTTSSPLMKAAAPAASGAPQHEAAPTSAAGSRASPPQRASTTPPHVSAKQAPNGPRQARNPTHGRHANQEAAQRQSDAILQRQRDAIKRSTQAQEAKATRRDADAQAKAAPREIDMKPTSNPVIIDPDDFGRDYRIKPGAHSAEGTQAARGSGRSRRSGGNGGGGGGGGGSSVGGTGGRGRNNKQATDGARGNEVDFVLKSGSPRGAARGRGKLWVP